MKILINFKFIIYNGLVFVTKNALYLKKDLKIIRRYEYIF